LKNSGTGVSPVYRIVGQASRLYPSNFSWEGKPPGEPFAGSPFGSPGLRRAEAASSAQAGDSPRLRQSNLPKHECLNADSGLCADLHRPVTLLKLRP